MNVVWFWTLAFMFTVFALLDGYDLGVGAVHLWVARDNQQRRVNLNAIGPVWNGNEVWLIAAGGMMVLSFPRLYAASFSGFYLALVMVLWLLILRGVSIEFRGQFDHELWHAFWDAVFGIASLLLALLLGVALGNVVQGLPIGADGYFVGSFTLMLNPYATLIGLLSLAVLSWHGLNFLRTKTEGEQEERVRRWSRAAWWAALILAVLATAASTAVSPGARAHFHDHPALLAIPALGLFGFLWGRDGGPNRSGSRVSHRAFVGSSLVIIGLLGAAAVSLFPVLLPSTIAPVFSLTVYNSAGSPHGLLVGFIANALALVLVALYGIRIHRAFRGRVVLNQHGY